MLVAAVVGALALAGIFGYVMLRPNHAVSPLGPQAASSLPSPTAASPDTATTPTPTPTSSLVKVRIITDPDGASVKEDGVELCSATPCDILYKGSDADPSKQHKLTISRNGYRNENRSVTIGDSPVSVKLIAAPVIIRQQPQQKPDQPSLPPGYKPDIPY
jgi:hypothetical protein